MPLEILLNTKSISDAGFPSLSVNEKYSVLDSSELDKVAFTPPQLKLPILKANFKDKLPIPPVVFTGFKIIVSEFDTTYSSFNSTVTLPFKITTSDFIPETVIVHLPFGKFIEYCVFSAFIVPSIVELESAFVAET